jgi:hypothetical protein
LPYPDGEQRVSHLRGKTLATLLLVAPAAVAAGDAPWTVESGKPVGEGSNVFWGQGGYPGIWAEFIHGVTPTLEIGGKFAFNYGLEGIVPINKVGLDFQFLVRKQFFDNGKMRIAGRLDPGLLLYFPSGTTVIGIALPVGVEFGFPVTSEVSINASFGAPMYVDFARGSAGFVIPILFGGGVEYLLQPNVALTFHVGLGPSFVAGNGYVGGSPAFTLYALFGAAYKFD